VKEDSGVLQEEEEYSEDEEDEEECTVCRTTYLQDGELESSCEGCKGKFNKCRLKEAVCELCDQGGCSLCIEALDCGHDACEGDVQRLQTPVQLADMHNVITVFAKHSEEIVIVDLHRTQ